MLSGAEYLGKIIWAGVVAVLGYVIWTVKRITTKIDNTYTKDEILQIVDLKLTTVKAELAALKANDARLEAQLHRLEQKIDRLLEMQREGRD
jgi:ubiquinone biosynthesis protein UbiJ